jgi:hypothetical protein
MLERAGVAVVHAGEALPGWRRLAALRDEIGLRGPVHSAEKLVDHLGAGGGGRWARRPHACRAGGLTNFNCGIEGSTGGVRFCIIRAPDEARVQLCTVWVLNCTHAARMAEMVQKRTPHLPTQRS